MTTITIPRALLEQALKVLTSFEQNHGSMWYSRCAPEQVDVTCSVIRAELAKPVEHVTDREAFEAWLKSEQPKTNFQKSNGRYLYAHASLAWNAWQAATASERERCAKVCDAIAHDWRGANSQSVQCANAIRKGGPPC